MTKFRSGGFLGHLFGKTDFEKSLPNLVHKAKRTRIYAQIFSKTPKYAQNMRKYAQIPENRKYAQNMRKYAQICAAHIFPPPAVGDAAYRLRPHD